MTKRILKIAAVAGFALAGAAPMAMAYTYAPGIITGLNPGQDSITINGHHLATASMMTDGHKLHVGERVLYKVDGWSSEPHVVAAIPARGLGMKTEFGPEKNPSMPIPRDVSGTGKARADGNVGAPMTASVTPDAPVPFMSGEAKQAAAMARG